MTLENLPTQAEFMEWSWPQMEPYFQTMLDRPLQAGNLEAWMSDWSQLRELVDETYSRLQLANARDTTDLEAEQRYHHFIEKVYPHLQAADQKLKEKLLASELEPEGFEIPMRNMRSEAELFRDANLPVMAEEHKLGSVYNKIFGAHTVTWNGEEVTPAALRPITQVPDRAVREKAWRLVAERQLADRQAINENWVRLMDVRKQLAVNAGFDDYRSFRWQQWLRFDYTPQDCQRFHDAIEEVVVPAATRIYERSAERLGVDRMRPWDLDLDVYPLHLPVLKAYRDPVELEQRAEAIFHKVDPVLGEYFAIMRREGLLDLPNRKGKSPGAFCTSFATEKRPFVFMNAVGLAGDVRTLLHECGHAFHVFERTQLPYHHQWRTTAEFAEVASMSMELLAAPYLEQSQGGYFNPADAERARAEHLEKIILFWPYMAVVDAFQHWVYENHAAASEPANCDAAWAGLWQRFLPGVDWSGMEEEMKTGWHRKLHIHRYPFYYVDYGIAQLGAVQIWRNALVDQPGAVAAYRHSLSLGGTVALPALFEAAGARFAFDTTTVKSAIDFLETQIPAS